MQTKHANPSQLILPVAVCAPNCSLLQLQAGRAADCANDYLSQQRHQKRSPKLFDRPRIFPGKGMQSKVQHQIQARGTKFCGASSSGDQQISPRRHWLQLKGSFIGWRAARCHSCAGTPPSVRNGLGRATPRPSPGQDGSPFLLRTDFSPFPPDFSH